MIDINSVDFQLQLLSGDSINVDNLLIKPLTLNEIKNMTTLKYYQYLNILCLDEYKIKEIFKVDEKINTLDFFKMNFIYKQKESVDIITNAFKNFIGEIEINNFDFYVNDIKLEVDSYYDIQKILKKQNCLMEKKDEEEFKPANEKAKLMIAKMAKAKERKEEVKAKEGLSLNLFDLISIYTAYSNINIFEVWNMTMFQFNNQFNRLRIMRDFDVNVQALIHGAESKDVKLKHWLCNERDLTNS